MKNRNEAKIDLSINWMVKTKSVIFHTESCNLLLKNKLFFTQGCLTNLKINLNAYDSIYAMFTGAYLGLLNYGC